MINRVLISILLGFIAWDVATTYFGALASFTGNLGDRVGYTLASASVAQHITSFLVAMILIVLLLLYKQIMAGGNYIAKGLLYIGFLIDFVTSLYGTGIATGVGNSEATGLSFILVLFLSVAATSSPLLIHLVYDSETDY